jgi:hypothetical protein
VKDTLFIIEQIYTSISAIVRRISHNESSLHGHESFKTCMLLKYNTILSLDLEYFQETVMIIQGQVRLAA